MGDRAARPGPARPSRARAGRTRGPAAASAGTIDEELARAVAGADPTEVVSLTDALDDPGDLPYSEAGARALRAAVGRAAPAPAPRRASRCSSWSAGSSTPAASTSSWRRRSATRPAPAATTSTSSSRRSPSSRPSTAPSRCRPCSPGSTPSTTATGLDVATPSPRPTRSSCSPSTGPRASSGTPCSSWGPARAGSRTPRAAGIWPTRQEFLPTPLRGDARDLPALPRPRRGGAQGVPRAHQGPRGHRGAAARIRRVHPRPAPARGVVVPLDGGPEDAARPVAVPGSGPRPARRVGRGPARVARQAGEGHAQPAGRDRAARRRGRSPSRPPRRCAGSTPPSGCVDDRRRRRRRGDPELDLVHASVVADWDDDPRAAAGRGTPRAVAAWSRCPLPASLSATALARLRDDPDAFAAELARPMPRPPAPSARLGTRFHEWVETRFGQPRPDRPRRAAGPRGRRDRRRRRPARADRVLRARAVRRPTAVPHVEAPFALVLAGQVVRGRIDAVYRERRRLAGRRLEDRREPRPPTRCSWRSIASPGPTSSGCRSTGSARPSTTYAPATSSSPTACPTATRWSGWSVSERRGEGDLDHGRRRSAHARRPSSPRR